MKKLLHCGYVSLQSALKQKLISDLQPLKLLNNTRLSVRYQTVTDVPSNKELQGSNNLYESQVKHTAQLIQL